MPEEIKLLIDSLDFVELLQVYHDMHFYGRTEIRNEDLKALSPIFRIKDLTPDQQTLADEIYKYVADKAEHEHFQATRHLYR